MSFGSSFLVEPSGVADETPWGPDRLVLQIAGRTHTIGGLSGAQKAALSQLYGSFVTLDRGSTPDIRVRRIGDEAFRDFDKRGWEYALEFDYGEPNQRQRVIVVLEFHMGCEIEQVSRWFEGGRSALSKPGEAGCATVVLVAHERPVEIDTNRVSWTADVETRVLDETRELFGHLGHCGPVAEHREGPLGVREPFVGNPDVDVVHGPGRDIGIDPSRQIDPLDGDE